jgi:excisionase family DNA binding protein
MSTPSCGAGKSPARLLYTIRETTGLLALSRASLYRYIASGELQAIKIGTATRIPAAEIDRWLAALPRLGRSDRSAP